jgi:hypothetical protein
MTVNQIRVQFGGSDAMSSKKGNGATPRLKLVLQRGIDFLVAKWITKYFGHHGTIQLLILIIRICPFAPGRMSRNTFSEHFRE